MRNLTKIKLYIFIREIQLMNVLEIMCRKNNYTHARKIPFTWRRSFAHSLTFTIQPYFHIGFQTYDFRKMKLQINIFFSPLNKLSHKIDSVIQITLQKHFFYEIYETKS